MIRFRRPGVDFYRVAQRDHQEFYPLVLDNLEMYRARQITNIYPASFALNIGVSAQNLGF